MASGHPRESSDVTSLNLDRREVPADAPRDSCWPTAEAGKASALARRWPYYRSIPVVRRNRSTSWRERRRESPAQPERLNDWLHFGGLSGDVVWRADGENALVAADQERPFQEACTLIVQEILVPAIFDQFGNDHNNMTIGVLFRELENVLNQGNNNEAVGRRQRGERRRHGPGGSKRLLDVALPFLVQEPGMLAGLHVNGDDFWRQP